MIVDATLRHVLRISQSLGGETRDIADAQRIDARSELVKLFQDSAWRKAWIYNGACLAVGGVTGMLASSEGTVWLAVSPDIKQHPRAAIREAQEALREIFVTYRKVTAVVPAAAETDLRFAEFLGFNFGELKASRGVIIREGILKNHTRAATSAPFIVYALPRSRTAWMADFLSYGDWFAYHEQAMHMRNVRDIKRFFARPFIGSVETAAAQAWRVIHHHVPNLKIAVVRRPVAEVMDSFRSLDLRGLFSYDMEKLQAIMEYSDRVLRQISELPGVLTLAHADLTRKEDCAALFEHCLPHKFDQAWWESKKDRNVQIDVPILLDYFHKQREEIDGFKRMCKAELRALVSAGAIGKEHHGRSRG